jgi:protocatechuate 3,4-dioxygenase beta subunit
MRASLIEPGTAGERLVITGSVFTRSCRPIAGAWLDFWQADAKGDYDNTGYTLRGHQFTDSEGGYRLETIVPGEYPGRTPHIHVKVRPPGGEVLTSQLYLPGEPGNRTDGIFDPALVMSVIRFGNDTQAVFDFVLDLE